ncbi:conserved Plasmodium protein, unknown function [Plasmodium vinckei vinckei]|uniref:Mediator of RNA polymerase II transcription subunit 18 n=1 Tax=Plasmodium vinckei vinckei TaxID=54757 RepID=A0A449C006_PLAVN|nr:conserved Plasmodium protein, unknown function [Plasmodium vinckei vinckei]KEG04134.1 hypothetical protein YYE_01037 [Plasmodium vinckei vinckei]VEV59067.1 conserved Plasmodium protein, unknown function [Plasmodium vinckei vinckei]
MNDNIDKLITTLISETNNTFEGTGINNENNAEDKNLQFTENEEKKLLDDDILKTLGKNKFFKYTEYSLSSLYISGNNMPINDDPNFQKLLNVMTKASDVNNKFKWVDSYFKHTVREDENILNPQSQNQDYIFREYIEPNHFKKLSLLRKYEQGAILKSSEKNKVNVRIVSEFIVHDTYSTIIKSIGYHLSHKLFTEAQIFHNKYGNSNHIVILVLRHYKDPNFSIPLYNDRVLVQIKSYLSDNKYSDITQKNLLNYAKIFNPYILLRKVDYSFVEQIKDKMSYAI